MGLSVERKCEIIDELVNYYEDHPFGYDTSRGTCVYRGSKGQKCAIGYYLKDDVIESALERFETDLESFNENGADDHTVKYALNESLEEELEEADYYFFASLQNNHDSAATDSDRDFRDLMGLLKQQIRGELPEDDEDDEW